MMESARCENHRLPLMAMKRTTELIPLMNFFAETLRETLDEWDVSHAEVSRITGIPSPHLTDMKKSRRRSGFQILDSWRIVG